MTPGARPQQLGVPGGDAQVRPKGAAQQSQGDKRRACREGNSTCKGRELGKGWEHSSNRKLTSTAGLSRAGMSARSGVGTSPQGPQQRGRGLKEDGVMGASEHCKETFVVPDGMWPQAVNHKPYTPTLRAATPPPNTAPTGKAGKDIIRHTGTGPRVWERCSQVGASRKASRRRGHLGTHTRWAGTAALPPTHLAAPTRAYLLTQI